jgi:nucleoside-diphosphate-sugar epimerase
MSAVLAGRPVDLTEGAQIRDYVYVRDVAEGVVAALLSSFEGATDIATGHPVSVRQMATEIARQAGREDLLRFGARPTPAHDAPMVLGDPAHAQEHIGWRATTTLQQGVSELLAWGRRRLSAAEH